MSVLKWYCDCNLSTTGNDCGDGVDDGDDVDDDNGDDYEVDDDDVVGYHSKYAHRLS